MLAGIGITCFFASYAVAWLLEASRLLFKSGVRGAVMIGMGAAGLAAHTLFLAYRATTEGAAPLSSEYDWYLVAAWVLAVAYLYMALSHPRTAAGLFILPLVMGLIAVAHFVSDRAPFPQSRASQVWGTIHGAFLLAGAVAVMTGFVTGWMYLLQSARLKRKAPPTQGIQLPSLEWLGRVNHHAMSISVYAFLAGFLSGAILNLANHARGDTVLPWSDPVVLSGGLLLAWVATASVFSWAYKPARQGRKVAYLTVASFVFLVLLLAIKLLAPTEHGA